jgi:hypothetical protein
VPKKAVFFRPWRLYPLEWQLPANLVSIKVSEDFSVFLGAALLGFETSKIQRKIDASANSVPF